MNAPHYRPHLSELGFECVGAEEGVLLDLHRDRLALQLPSGRLQLDWEDELRLLRAQKLGSKSDLFARAVRPSGAQRIKTVLDLTCGTGRDSLHLLALGLEVTTLEHDPYLFALQFFEAARLGANAPKVIFAEAATYLAASPSFDVIYFDPMYEDAAHAKKRKAAPRKEIQLFYEYFASLADASCEAVSETEILALARTKALRRVVVKRSLKAPSILSPAPYCYEGKSTRYDGYPPLGSKLT